MENTERVIREGNEHIERIIKGGRENTERIIKVYSENTDKILNSIVSIKEVMKLIALFVLAETQEEKKELAQRILKTRRCLTDFNFISPLHHVIDNLQTCFTSSIF